MLSDTSELTRAAYVEAMLLASEGIWDTDTPNPFDKRQLAFEFTVSGKGIEKFISWSDEGVPGGMRKVHAEYASPWHLFRSYDLKQKKANESIIAASRQLDIANVSLKACRNDMFARLWDFRDDLSKEAA